MTGPGGYKVIFSTDDARQIYDYFVDRMAAGMVYQQISDCEIGKPVCKYACGDPLTIRAVF